MDFPKNKIRGRILIVKWLLVLLGFAILGKALYTMTVKYDWWMEVAKKRERTNLVLKPQRGNILASNGEVLAASIPEYLMYMDFGTWEKDSARAAKDLRKRDSLLALNIDTICRGMAQIFPDIDSVKFKAHLLKGQKQRSHSWRLYTKDVLKPKYAAKVRNRRNQRITYVQYREVKELPFLKEKTGVSGFFVDTIPMRKNPYGNLARRTVGKFDEVPHYGLEKSCDSLLRGEDGMYHAMKMQSHLVKVIDKPAVDGYDVMTTIDVEIQDICENALLNKIDELEAEEGVCIVMEVKTGDIKAMTSLSRDSKGNYSEHTPLAVSNLYEPGSVFKPMSFLVAMNDGYLDLNRKVDATGGVRNMYGAKMKDHNWRKGGYGVLSTTDIIKYSSNIGVAALIDEFYHDNPSRYVDGLYKIGVAEDLQIPLGEYRKPRIRRPTTENWSKTALPWMSIGYETQVPPISTVNVYAGIANNGKLFRPRLVKALLKDGVVVKEFPSEVLREKMASDEALKMIQHCLYEVVHTGLGRHAGSKMFDVSGKTGTAQIWTRAGKSRELLISFVGYFPSQNPQYACIVCMRKSGVASGGSMCGPVFRRVAESIMAKKVQSDFSVARDTVNPLLPEVKHGNIAAARHVMHKVGLQHQAEFDETNSKTVWGEVQQQNSTYLLKQYITPTDSLPNLVGYGLRDAVYRLESVGLKVRAHGMGTVVQQVPKPGTPIHQVDSVVLTLRTQSKN
ncbi:MAG: transpeptidase family protein [Bacteroidaceae bacterium]|nr:transpeptidase family protein [Bacteroidaceae bacterium]